MVLDRITNFLTGLGFRLVRDSTSKGGFLPGILIEGMTLRINPPYLVSHGDILHDAGHVAIIPSLFRPRLTADAEASLKPMADEYFATHPFLVDETGVEDQVSRALLQTGDSEAQAWSYAAAMAADVPAKSVFHRKGYDGGSATIITMMQIGQHFGVHGLAAAGMTTRKSFPTMRRWLQI